MPPKRFQESEDALQAVLTTDWRLLDVSFNGVDFGPDFDALNHEQDKLVQMCAKHNLDGTALTAKVHKREPRRVVKRSYTDIEKSVAEIIADTKLKAGPIIRAVGFISYTCDDMLNGLRLKRRRVADAKEAADQKKQDAKAKLEEKAKAILTGDDTFEKWSKDKLLTVLKYKEVPGVAHQMDKDALRTAYENTLPLAERRDDTLPLAERETQQAANPIP